ncbi:M48 family metallopeptidase [Pseudoduganella umbonata]|uniref:Peptidase M48 domain-containing protein n=1 Tax=Pseudoduganella umbonata TaxID=864828 RepID=A0A4P8HK52_9BURK|nr:M48 family metallopeptidase [Pseudoduganella umbonata]MBB3220006.1 hypothetical protein [Pseudoduganella umbonata]QCP10013.1 hypothetical protein FCL38_05945 [Pseudoduganella umbonata]
MDTQHGKHAQIGSEGQVANAARMAGHGHTYLRLVRRLERDAHEDPAAFRRRVMLVGGAASAAIAIVLALFLVVSMVAIRHALGAHSGATAVKLALLALLPLAALLIVLRALYVRLPSPEGRPLTRAEAPALFDMLDRIRVKLDGPRIDHVLVDERYNAAAAQRARIGLLGIFGLFGFRSGGSTNYLTLGLPYLLGVPAREMAATVAHEYGHLCGNHGKSAAWLYRQRLVFGTLHGHLRALAAGSLLHRGIAAVLDRLMPYYNAYTFVLARQNEYDADRTASGVAGSVVNAQGLVRDTLQARWIADAFWPTLLRQADDAERPLFMPFAAMRTALKAGYAHWAQPAALAAALAERSGVHDTHPCLRERVDAIGERPALPRPVDRPAADALLPPDTLCALIQEFDEAWWARTGRQWQARHREASRDRSRLAELGALPLAALSLASLHELALLRAERESPAAARDVLAHLLAQPGGPFPRAAFHYGCILLADGSDAGLFHLEAAVAHDRTLADAATAEGCAFLLRTKGQRAARLWREALLPRAA